MFNRVGKSSRLTVWLEIFWRLNRKPQTVKNLVLQFETKIAKNLGKIDQFSSKFYAYQKLFYILSLQRYSNRKITFKKTSTFCPLYKISKKERIWGQFLITQTANRKPSQVDLRAKSSRLKPTWANTTFCPL